jgi:capsular exopolysaccharide synthesis family protein
MSDGNIHSQVIDHSVPRSYKYDGPLEVSDQESGLLDIWRILAVLRRWWWLIALIVTFCTAIAAVILFRMAPIYKATALLEVKQEERNIVDVSAIERVTVDNEFLTTQIELLQSETLIEDTIERLNLLSDPYMVPLDDPEWQSLPRDQRLRGLVQSFKVNLSVRPVGRSRLISLSFEHADSKKAALIANTMTENFLANGLSRKFNATADARDFLSERLTVVRNSLEEAERNLVAYAKDNGIINANNEDTQDGSSSLDMNALRVLNAELTAASVARVEAQANYEQSLKSEFMAELLENDSIARLQSERIALNAEYLEKLAIYKPQFPLMVELKSRIELFDQEIAQRTEDVKSAARVESEAVYNLALNKETDLKRRVRDLKALVIDTREKSVDYNILKRQVETERTQYEALLQRLKEVSVADDLGSNLIEVVDRAQIPNLPFKPNRLQGLALALFLSGVLGFAIAYILELLDDHIKGPEDVKSKLGEIIMGVIPVGKNPNDFLVELTDPQSAVSESYASLRTNLQFSGADGGPRVIQITSTRSGEGKSVTSLATALRFAGIGKKVLLIDADMRLPTFVQSGSQSIGLSGVLTSRVDYADEIIDSQYDNLDLLPSGVIVPNPSEILSGGQFDALLDYARKHYDYIIVDGPPVLGLADAPIIGAKVDATLLIIETAKLRTPNVRASLERLKTSGTKVLGVVLTKYKAQGKGYMNYYQYAYGGKDKAYQNKPRKETKAKKAKRKLNIT